MIGLWSVLLVWELISKGPSSKQLYYRLLLWFQTSQTQIDSKILLAFSKRTIFIMYNLQQLFSLMPLQDYINLFKKQFDKNDTLWFFWRSSWSTFHLIFILKMQKTHGQFAIRALVGQAASVTTKLETVIGLSIKLADFIR